MGGKTSTSTAQTTIPPEVLARYNSVNTQAQQTAATPFQQYSTDPNAFVAPMTATQNAGVANVNAASGMAQPYFNTATGFTLAGSNAVNPSAIDATAINQFQNPYLNAVLGSTSALINQNNQQAQAGQLGNAITSGAFGGDRAGIAAATLAGQQQLAAGQTYSGIASDAYSQALAAAQQQQGVSLAAQQANRAALQQTGESMAGLGTAAQGAALQGAQAQLGAGQVAQQTQQAGLTALYNQFLQQQSYPFQVAQFLANIAEGTGALSGSTTTQTTPGGLFMSDERLKEGMEPIGKGFDGANIYRFRYKGDPTTRIGFSAQETERRHPEAVHHVGGFKAVDQQAATEEAANRGGFANAANDNGEDMPRRAAQAGGYQGFGGVAYPGHVMPFDVAALLQAQAQMYGPYAGSGLYGGSASGAPHGGSSYVPQANVPIAHLMAPQVSAPRQQSGVQQALGMGAQLADTEQDIKKAAPDIQSGWNFLTGRRNLISPEHSAETPPSATGVSTDVDQLDAPVTYDPSAARGGFIRAHRQYGGGDSPDDISSTQDDDPYKPKGAGLDIPTQGSKITPLQGPKVGGGGGGGSGLLGEAAGAAGDISSIVGLGKDIAGAAPAIGGFLGSVGSGISSLLPFLALAHRGGRIGYAAGGAMDPTADLISDIEGSDNDPIEDALLHQAMAPAPQPAGFAKAATGPNAPAEAAAGPAGGGGSPGAPPAGFAGAKRPGTAAEAAPTGFAGISPGFEGTLHAEGTGLNKASGAFGPGQFLPKTFLGEFKQVFPQRAATMSDSEIMALQHSSEGPQLQAQMIPHLRAENAATLQHHGLPVTPVTEHGMWILGPVEGPRVLSADPSTPMENLVRPIAIAENRNIMAGKTAGQFVQWLGHSIGRARGGFAGARRGYQTDGLVTGDDTASIPADSAGLVMDPDAIAQADADKRVRAEAAAAAAGAAPKDAAALAAPAAAAPAAVADPGVVGAANRGLAAEAGAAQQQYAGANQGLAPTDQSGGAGAPRGGVDYLPLSEQQAAIERERLMRLQGEQTQQKPGLWGWLSQPSHFMPLISAVAGTLAAPTKYPLVALSQGALAGAGTYQQQRAYEAAQAQKDAEIAALGENVQTGAYTGRTQRLGTYGNVTQYLLAPGGPFDRYFVPSGYDANGSPLYRNMLPGHEKDPPITGGQLAQMKQQAALGMLSGLDLSGNPAGQISQMYDKLPGGGGGGPPSTGASDGHSINTGGGPPSAVSGNPPAGTSVPPPNSGGATGGTGGGGAGGASVDTGTGGSAAVTPSGQQVAKHPALPANATYDQKVRAGTYSLVGQPLTHIDASQFTPATNIDYLTQQANAALNAGDRDGYNTRMQTVAQIQSGELKPIRLSDNQPDDSYIKQNNIVNENNAEAAKQAALKTQTEQDAQDFAASRGPMSQIIKSLATAYQKGDPEGLAQATAIAVGRMRSIPWLKDHIPQSALNAEDLTQWATKEANRDSILMALQTGMQHGAPATTMNHTDLTVPAPGMGAGARYHVLTEQLGLMRRQAQYYGYFENHKDNIQDVTRFSNDWNAENQQSRSDQWARDQIAPFRGMTDDELKAAARHPQKPGDENSYGPGWYYQDPQGRMHRRPGNWS